MEWRGEGLDGEDVELIVEGKYYGEQMAKRKVRAENQMWERRPCIDNLNDIRYIRFLVRQIESVSTKTFKVQVVGVKRPGEI